MSRSKELLKNTGILLIAKISTQIVNFLLIPFYTGILTTAEYGEIDIYTSLVMIIVPFLTLQLEMGLFRFFIEESSNEERTAIITTSFITIARVVLIISVVYWIAYLIIGFDNGPLLYAYYLSVTLSSVLLQVCRAYGKNISYGLGSFLISALTVSLNVFFIKGLGMRVSGVLLSTAIANSAGSMYMLSSTHVLSYFNRLAFSSQKKKELLNYSVPLVFNQVSSWAINYSDRIIIMTAWGTSFNGIYSLANKFSNITNTFFGVYNVAWSENVIRSMHDEDSKNYINKVFMITYNLYLVLVTGIINVLPFFFGFFVNGNYHDAYGHIPILLVAMFFSGMAATIGSIYIAYGRTKDVSITTTMAGVCNIIVHLALLRSCRLYAASISTLVSFSLLFLYRYIFVQRFFKLKFKFVSIIPQLFIYAISWWAYIQQNKIMIIMGLALNLAFFAYMMKNYWNDIRKILIRK